MHKEDAERGSSCVFCAGFCARGSPCITSHIPHNKRAMHVMESHLTKWKVEAPRCEVKHRGQRAGEEGSQDPTESV